MELHRFFTDEALTVGKNVDISGDEAYHMTKVLRLKVGFTVIVCNGDDYDYYAKIVDINKDSVTLNVYDRVINETTPSVGVNLYQCITKADKFAFIVQKAVELGVRSITPVISEYSNPNELNSERLNRVAIEACKQCGASKITTINAPVKLSEIEFKHPVYMGYEHEDKVSLADIEIKDKEIDLLIGSEGGFSEKEVEALRTKGVTTFSVGKRILRVETATVSLIALTMYKMGGMRL